MGRGADVGWDWPHPSGAGLPCAHEYAANGISPGWRLVELTVAICCPLGQARDLCVQRHTWADTLLWTWVEAWPLPVARLMLTQLCSPKQCTLNCHWLFTAK